MNSVNKLTRRQLLLTCDNMDQHIGIASSVVHSDTAKICSTHFHNNSCIKPTYERETRKRKKNEYFAATKRLEPFANEERELFNARERVRTATMADAVDKLRDILPNSCAPVGNKPLSKMSILKSAVEYIGYLSDVLEFGEENCDRRLNRKYEGRLRELHRYPPKEDVHKGDSVRPSNDITCRKLLKVRRRNMPSKSLPSISTFLPRR